MEQFWNNSHVSFDFSVIIRKSCRFPSTLIHFTKIAFADEFMAFFDIIKNLDIRMLLLLTFNIVVTIFNCICH